jgi:chromosomal replication initiator protein
VSDAGALWTTLCARVREQVSEASWLTSFQDVHAASFDGRKLTLAVENWLLKERFEQRHLGRVTAELREVIGRPDAEVNVEVHDRLPNLEALPDPRELDPAPHDLGSGPATVTIEPVEERAPVAGLDARYTFENFVTGASNRFAHAAALAVAETPARSYNPLFIHGGAGLGKTHLLHAIAHYVHQTNLHTEVRYVSTEAFLNEYVEAIRTSATGAFKRRFREADILLVDDIQFMEGKEGLQEEFFHTFNSLHGAGRQIVLSSDRPPRAIATLEERLRSRFEWGLITDIQPPDLETRIAILRKKAEVDRTPAPDDVLEFIASHVTSNIRELEGALIRVSAYASLNDESLGLDLARRVLGDIVDTEPRPITVANIIAVTSEYFGFPAEELCGKQRHRALVTARQISMYLCRELTDLSYPQIGREFGGRDHTTVMHAVDKITKLIGENREIYEQVSSLIQQIRGR